MDLATVGSLLEDTEARHWRDVLAQPSQDSEAVGEEEASMPRAMTKALEKETADVGIELKLILTFSSSGVEGEGAEGAERAEDDGAADGQAAGERRKR